MRAVLLGVLLLTIYGCYLEKAFGAGPNEPAGADTARALAASIDGHLAARWEAAGVQPARPADDAEFLRRICLDVTGRIPSVSEVRDFLDDPSPDKRDRAIERLLTGSGFSRHFARVWRDAMLPEVSANPELAGFGPSFEAWLRTRLEEGVSYDRIAAELLTLQLPAAEGQRLGFSAAPQMPVGVSPSAFYDAKQQLPENVATGAARVFLGVSLECAQCHDHPFADWRRDQFWGLAAFFAELQTPGGRPELTIPETATIVPAAYLNGSAFDAGAGEAPRAALARWITSPENPYFARATVNRLWAHFHGIGLVQPVDDLGADNPASHPELLDELARRFVASGFDLRFLVRALVSSQAYQCGSRQTDPGQADPTLFARMNLRALTAEQLYDALLQATAARGGGQDAAFRRSEAQRVEFLNAFQAPPGDATQGHTSIVQALTLMNGSLVADATSLERSRTLAAVADAPFMTTAERIEALYLASVSRPPQSAELERLVKFVEEGDAQGRGRAALADVFWSLLNSAEFRINH